MSRQLSIRKRPLGEDGPYTSSSTSSTKAFLEELLSPERKARRVISPMTEERAKELLAMCNLENASLGVQRAVTHAKAELERRLASDEKYAEEREKLNELHQEQFFLRYGDYHAMVLGKLRKGAKSAKSRTRKLDADTSRTTEKTLAIEEDSSKLIDGQSAQEIFRSRPWATINEILKTEDERIKWWELDGSPGEKPKTPMLEFLFRISISSLDFNIEEVKRSIDAYSRRNQIAHTSLQNLAIEGQWLDLANQIQKDLQGLATAPTTCHPFVDTTKKAILQMAEKYFSLFDWDENQNKLKDYLHRPLGEIFPSATESPRAVDATGRKKKAKRTHKKAGSPLEVGVQGLDEDQSKLFGSLFGN